MRSIYIADWHTVWHLAAVGIVEDIIKTSRKVQQSLQGNQSVVYATRGHRYNKLNPKMMCTVHRTPLKGQGATATNGSLRKIL